MTAKTGTFVTYSSSDAGAARWLQMLVAANLLLPLSNIQRSLIMKSIIYTMVAATALWIGGAFTSTADAVPRGYYRGGYSYGPRYYGNYNYGPRYYSYGYNRPYRSYYRPYYYGQPYYGGYYGGYYGAPYYGGYYAPGVSIGVGPVGVRAF